MDNPVLFYQSAVNRKHTYLPALTGVRAVAALLVFFSHFNPFNEQIPSQRWAFIFVHQGHFGVPIFFVLSGFLIATRHKSRVELNSRWFYAYMKNRVARIYPLYFIITAVTFLVYQVDPSYDFLGLWAKSSFLYKTVIIVSNFTLLRGFFANLFFYGISQGWSLTVEESFYILAPFILYTTNKRNAPFLLLWTVSLIGVGFLLVFIFSPYSNVLLGFFGSIEFMFQWTFFGHALEFMAGIGLAFFVARQDSLHKQGVLLTYAGIIWIILCAAFVATAEQSIGEVYHPGIKILMMNFLLPPGICFLLYGLLREKTFIRKLLETRVADLLGKSSYAFYLIHLGILSVALSKVGSFMLVSLIITILLSILLFKLVEEPAHKYIKDLK